MDIIIILGAVLLLVGIAVVTFWARYETVGPEEAMIITGSMLGSKNVVTDETQTRKVKIIRGGGAFVIPIVQDMKTLPLTTHKLTVHTNDVYTSQGVPVVAEGTTIIKIGSSIEQISIAAEQFLGKSDKLAEEATVIMEGYLRAIIGKMTVEELNYDKTKFSQNVQELAEQDLKKMGLTIVSFTIKELKDKNGYLEALGKPKIAEVKREADIQEANAKKDTRINIALAEEEAKKAEIVRDTNIAEAQKVNALRVASFKEEQDKAKAKADAAYEIEQTRNQKVIVEQQMAVKLTEKEREIEIAEKETVRKEREYDANIRKKAEAERYKIEQESEATKTAKMRVAEADSYQLEKIANAQAEQKRVDGLADADVTKAKGLAEAEAEREKGLAEAEIIKARGLAEAEAKEKLAEAFNKFGEAAVLDLVVKMLPELASEVAKPLANIDKITVIDSNGEGANKVSGYVANALTTLPQLVKDTTNFDVLEALNKRAGQTTNSPVAETVEIVEEDVKKAIEKQESLVDIPKQVLSRKH